MQLAVGVLHLEPTHSPRMHLDQYTRLGVWAAREDLALVDIVQVTGQPVPDHAALTRLAHVMNEALERGARVVLITDRAFDPAVIDPRWTWPDVIVRVIDAPNPSSILPRQQRVRDP